MVHPRLRRHPAFLTVILGLIRFATPSSAQPPDDLALTAPVVTGLDRAVAIRHAGDESGDVSSWAGGS